MTVCAWEDENYVVKLVFWFANGLMLSSAGIFIFRINFKFALNVFYILFDFTVIINITSFVVKICMTLS